MVRHVISVCMFCFLCASHCGCSAIHEQSNPLVVPASITTDGISQTVPSDHSKHKDAKLIDTLFHMFSDGGRVLTIAGFERFLRHFLLANDTAAAACVTDPAGESRSGEPTVNYTCTTQMAAELTAELCTRHTSPMPRHRNGDAGDEQGGKQPAFESIGLHTWLYSICAVVVISACGLLALLIVPIMQSQFYKPLLQFLVALAVGALAGDALLHLLPHAMSCTDDELHHHQRHDHDDQMGSSADGHTHDANIWKGLVAMLGLTLFFLVERFIPLACKWRKNRQKHKGSSHVKVVTSGVDVSANNETQCMDKYNAYPLCYKEILNDPNTTFIERRDSSKTRNEQGNKRKTKPQTTSGIGLSAKRHDNGNHDTQGDSSTDASTEFNRMLPGGDKLVPGHDNDYTVILREHAATHHGHSHTHGHVHAAPQNLSTVAWMVIMGDGLHNFTDGMAIGAAFAASTTGGFSTSVAVFCHELPHELGDFAMLLKAGMSIKQALCYNLLSSVLCLMGNVLGLWLGNIDSATSWVFALAAGTFLYIALVDMIPELSSAHEDEGNVMQCILHLSGVILGLGIMALIALFEHDLKNLFN